MFLFKKLFHVGNSKRDGARESEKERKRSIKKSLKNPTYSVEQIERSKLPSVEDLKLLDDSQIEHDQTAQSSSARSADSTTDESAKRIECQLQIAKEFESTKQTKVKQVAVVCPIYQNVSAVVKTDTENQSQGQSQGQSQDQQDQIQVNSSDPMYANTVELKVTTDTSVQSVTSGDTNTYQNVQCDGQSTVPDRDTGIYQNIGPSVAPTTSDSTKSKRDSDEHDYEEATSPISSPTSPKKAKPQRPPLPSEDSLRKTEYFKIKGKFMKEVNRNTCTGIIDRPRPLIIGSPALNRKKEGRLNSERARKAVSPSSTLRKVSSMSNITDVDDAEDYLDMNDKNNRKLFIPNIYKKPSPSCGGKASASHVTKENTESDDDSDSEDYLNMSENSVQGDDKGDGQDRDDDDEQEEDYIPMNFDEEEEVD